VSEEELGSIEVFPDEEEGEESQVVVAMHVCLIFEDTEGHLVPTDGLTAQQARNLAKVLLDAADKIDPRER